MIFVTVGTHSIGFPRLVKAMDELAGTAGETVVMQLGSTVYTPAHANVFSFAPQNEMEHWYTAASVIVSHAGAGSILLAQKYGKPLVLAPRLKKYGEIIDDHQLELAVALQESGRAVMVEDMDQLAAAINQARQLKVVASSNKSQLITALKVRLDQMEVEQALMILNTS